MSKSEINETFKVFSALLEERKSELMRELDGMYTSKQVAMSVYSQKAQEVVDKIFQVSESPCDASFLVNPWYYQLVSPSGAFQFSSTYLGP